MRLAIVAGTCGCDYFPEELLSADAAVDQSVVDHASLDHKPGLDKTPIDASHDVRLDTASVDANLDTTPVAPQVDATPPLTKFGVVKSIPGANTSGSEKSPHLSQDTLRLYFTATRKGGVGDRDIWVTSRASTTAPFGPATLVPGVNTKNKEEDPSLTADERIIVWEVDSSPDSDLFYATRASKGAAFGSPQPLSTLNTSHDDVDPGITPDGLTLVFGSYRPGGKGSGDLYISTRSSTTKTFGAPVLIAAANSSSDDYDPFLSDGGQLVFVSLRPGGKGKNDLWMSQRSGSTFSTPVNLSINTSEIEEDPFVHTASRLLLLSRLNKSDFDLFWVTY